MDSATRTLLSELLLLVDPSNVAECTFEDSEWQVAQSLIQSILAGKSSQVITDSAISPFILGDAAQSILSKYPNQDLKTTLQEFVHHLVHAVSPLPSQLIAIALLQLYIQSNFTGPEADFDSSNVWFPNAEKEKIQADCLDLLRIEGKSAYDLMNQPLFLVISLYLFEFLQGTSSLLGTTSHLSIEDVTAENVNSLEKLNVAAEPVSASLLWWRARALQVHLSVLSEPSDILASISSILLNQQVVNSLAPANETDLDLQKHVQLVFLLENARNGIHAQTEHLSEQFLHKAAQISQMQFVLSGAKAKRTKFQNFTTASLILLAKSKDSLIYKTETAETRETLDLNSDLLLEKPQYESLDNFSLEFDQPDAKKIKLDDLSHLVDSEEKRLFPIAMTQDDIPSDLLELDPNNQPTLTDLDNIQLLLRLTTLRQTSPSGNALVNEELSAVVNRIVYSTTKSINWSVFGRALWERSALETKKSRTVERGILQMTALVEEMGINIKTRVLLSDNSESETSSVASRLRFIHQLPLMANWTMDAKLAEKYMSLGVLKSAIDIYLRLNMAVEAALCYAAVDDEAEAERLLIDRIQSHPNDVRAISILGDIKEDPLLWNKAWEIGKYAKAKASLSRYYYNPPQSSGLSKNLQLAIENMHECLCSSPLSYENWYFYGCCGLEIENYELAAEAFTRCVSLDDTNAHAWSNLASALLRLDKTRQAFTALKRALQQGEANKRSWRIFENYLLVAAKLGEWNDVLYATKELISLRQEDGSATIVDIPVIERLMQILVEEPYPEDIRLTHFQKSCMDLICNILPNVINNSARCWRIVSRVELWRGKPWAALECHEKAYRATALRPELELDEDFWNDAVEACSDLVSAYESLGELPGKHGAGDVVCKDWKYKSKSCIRSLMSKGKAMWEDSDGWNTLQDLKESVASL